MDNRAKSGFTAVQSGADSHSTMLGSAHRSPAPFPWFLLALLPAAVLLSGCALLPNACLLNSCPCRSSYTIYEPENPTRIVVRQSPGYDKLFDSCSCRKRLQPYGARVALIYNSDLTNECRPMAALEAGIYEPVEGHEARNILRNAAGQLGANAVVLDSFEPGLGVTGRALHCSDDFLTKFGYGTIRRKEPGPKKKDEPDEPQTKLAWQRCSYGQGAARETCTGDALSSTYIEARRYCENLDADGRTWRLPAVEELRRLLDAKQPDTAAQIDPQRFPNTRRHVYWTATPYRKEPNTMWVVDFETGEAYGYADDNPGFVRCVSEEKPDDGPGRGVAKRP